MTEYNPYKNIFSFDDTLEEKWEVDFNKYIVDDHLSFLNFNKLIMPIRIYGHKTIPIIQIA